MSDHRMLSGQDVFKYHFLQVKKDVFLRYGIMPCLQPASCIILILHGRSEFVEKYQEIANTLQKRGFQVVSPDWRGQGLSFRELENRHKGHINRFDDYIDDLESFYSKIIAPYGLPVYILAHSMGAHIALRFMSRHPLKIKKAILVSPMIDIALPKGMKTLSKIISKKISKTSFARNYTIGSTDYASKKAQYRRNKLSHDPEKFCILHNEIQKNPDLALGGVTWGWLHAAFESIENLKQKDTIKKIKTPILMLSAQKDAIVSPKAQEKISRELPDCEFLSIQDAFHELLFEEPCILKKIWDAVDRFIKG